VAELLAVARAILTGVLSGQVELLEEMTVSAPEGDQPDRVSRVG
jgi:hypothetical protein